MAKIKELIKAATIATAIDKQTGKVLGFAVKSNSSQKYYQVTFLALENGQHEFFCTCTSAEYGFHNCRPDEQGNKCCAHIKAIQEVLVAKAELMQAQGEEAVVEAGKIVTAQPVETEQGVSEVKQASGKFHAGMFLGGKGISVYVSDAEMDALKARVAARKAQKAAEQKTEVIEFGQAVTVKRSPAFSNRGFYVAPVAELNGRSILLKH